MDATQMVIAYPLMSLLILIALIHAYWGAASVFALRGIAGYIPAAMAYAKDTPFHRLNRLYYSPLCLIIAAGFAQIGLSAN